VRIHGERRFDAPPGAVYEALTDPEQLAEAFSAIERVDAGEDEWTVVVRPPVPGLRLKFSVRLEDLRDGEHARLRAWGKSLGGRMSVDSWFDLFPDGAGTLMRWEAEVDAAGVFHGLASQRLAPVATHQAEWALDRLAQGAAARAR
jgi:carbon monoxide dehydrogenase subunit G